MRVSRREFAWVFPQLSLLGQTSSESCMRVDESLSSFFDFLVFARCFHAFFLRFLTLVKLLTIRVITPTVTCRWYVIIFSCFLDYYYGQWLGICNSLRLSCNSHDRSNEPNLSLTLIKIWTSSKLMRVHESVRELMRVVGQTRARVATHIHSHPRLIRPLHRWRFFPNSL